MAREALQSGDLVFFQNTHPYLAGVSHVGISVGNRSSFMPRPGRVPWS